jgi:hypothetical protein
MDLEIHAFAGIQWRQDECEKQGAQHHRNLSTPRLSLSRTNTLRALFAIYTCISRKNTNAKESVAETVISNRFVNLKVF